MSDNLKTLITGLPEIEPKEGFAQETAWQIIRKELVRLWEVRLSEALAVISIILSVLTVVHVYGLVGVLGTSGFWRLVIEDQEWIADDFSGVWKAFVEAHPFKQLCELLVLVFLLAFSLHVFLIKKAKEEKLKSNVLPLLFIIFLLLMVFILAYIIIFTEANPYQLNFLKLFSC